MPTGPFRREDRLLSRSDFLRLKARGRKVHTEHLIVLYAPSRAGRLRLGLTASTKVGDAVRRNRVKRWLREVFRADRQAVPGPYDLVIIAKVGAADAGFVALRKQFAEAARKLPPPREERP